jgi:hypothetical protein
MRAFKFAIAIALATVTATMLASGAFAATQHDQSHDSLGSVRAATDRFHTLSVAQHHGYALLKDAAGIACIANPGVGTMGVHYVNGDLVGSGKIDALKPQALVYEPGDHGSLHLVAVEYIAFQQAWDASHHAPPSLFGQQFMLTPDGNRFGIPAFYSLHAWVWKNNPSGTFSMWNPRVHCDPKQHGDGDGDSNMNMDMNMPMNMDMSS